MVFTNYKTIRMNNGKKVTVVKSEERGKTFNALLVKCCAVQTNTPSPYILDYSFNGEDFIGFLLVNKLDGFVTKVKAVIQAEELERYKLFTELDKEVLDELGIK